MHNFKLDDLKEIHVGNVPAAKMGICPVTKCANC
jgi:hypothetical protein